MGFGEHTGFLAPKPTACSPEQDKFDSARADLRPATFALSCVQPNLLPSMSIATIVPLAQPITQAKVVLGFGIALFGT